MKKFMVFLLVVGAALAYVGLAYHFILFDEKITVLRKDGYSYHNTLVDARGAKLFKIATQPDLLKAGLKNVLESGQGFSIPLP
jgi:hypothetical protein